MTGATSSSIAGPDTKIQSLKDVRTLLVRCAIEEWVHLARTVTRITRHGISTSSHLTTTLHHRRWNRLTWRCKHSRSAVSDDNPGYLGVMLFQRYWSTELTCDAISRGWDWVSRLTGYGEDKVDSRKYNRLEPSLILGLMCIHGNGMRTSSTNNTSAGVALTRWARTATRHGLP